MFFGDDADEIALDDDLHESRDVTHGAFVHALERGAHCWRPHDAPVQHAGQPHVVDVLQLCGRHGGQIETVNRSAQHDPLARMFALRGAAQRDVELLSADELSVSNVLRGIAPHTDDAAADRELFHGSAQSCGRKLQQGFPGGGAGEREIRVIEVLRVRLRSGCDALVWRHAGHALNERHAIDRHAELFGNQLRLRGVESLPNLALAGVGGHIAVSRDRDPRIELS